MNNSPRNSFFQGRLYRLLESLETKELKKLALYFESPYFNKSFVMKILCNFFRQKKKYNKLNSITKEEIFSEIYGRKKFNDTLLRKQLSDFTKHTESFLVLTAAGRDYFLRKNLLLQEANNRKLEGIFKSVSSELESKYSLTAEKDTDYYLNILNTRRIIYEHRASTLKQPEESITELSGSLDLFFLSLKLLYYYDILNLRMHYNKNIEFDMWAFDEISRIIESSKDTMIKDNSAIYADYLSVQMLLHPADGKYYKELQNFVSDHKHSLGSASMHKMYVILYNHSVYRLNRGFVKDNKELYGIIRKIDTENIPIWNYFAFHIYYINAVTNAARAGEFEWAEDFIKRRKELIIPEIRDETNSLALANLNFTKKDFNTALRYLVNVDYPNYSYYLMAKDMLIKIYWERSEPEGVLSTIEAVRKFLQRKDLIPERLWKCYNN